MYHFYRRTAEPLEPCSALGYDKVIVEFTCNKLATAEPHVRITSHTAPPVIVNKV